MAPEPWALFSQKGTRWLQGAGAETRNMPCRNVCKQLGEARCMQQAERRGSSQPQQQGLVQRCPTAPRAWLASALRDKANSANAE